MPGTPASPAFGVQSGPQFMPTVTVGFQTPPTVKRVQTNIAAVNAGGAATGPWTITFTGAVTAGDLLVLCIGNYNVSTPTINDTQGNTYVQRGTTLTGAGTYLHKTYSCIAKSSSAANGNVVTISFSANVTFVTFAIAEYSGVDTFDTSSQAQATSAGPASSGNLTTTHPNELLIGWLSNDTPRTFTVVGAGWTQQQQTAPTGNWLLSDNLNVAPGSYAAVCTITGGSTDWLSQQSAFYLSATATLGTGGINFDGTGVATVSTGINRAAGFPSYKSPANSFSVSWAQVGDLAIICGASFAASGDTITGISSAKVSGWTQVVDGVDTTNNGSVNIWVGIVNATGADTVTVTWTTTPTAFEVVADEWSGPGTGWSVQAQGSLNAPSSPWPYPNLTSGTLPPGELYWGYQQGQGSPGGGAGTGFTFVVTSDGNYIANNSALASTTAYQPTSTGFTSAVFSAAAIFTNGTGAINVVGTGGITFAGTGTPIVTVNGTGTGAIAFGASGALAITVTPTGTGAITFGGSGTATAGVSTSGSGAITFGGSGTASFFIVGTGTGAVTFGGTANPLVTIAGTGSGAITFGGTGSATLTENGVGTGAITFGGSGTASYVVPVNGSGAIAFGGSGTPSVQVTGTGSGAITFGGAGTASYGGLVPASGSGAVVFGGAGVASVNLNGVGSGAIAFAAAAVASVKADGVGTGAILFNGSGVTTISSHPTGTGVLTFDGTGSLSGTVSLTGTGAIVFGGSLYHPSGELAYAIMTSVGVTTETTLGLTAVTESTLCATQTVTGDMLEITRVQTP
jgi:fibronectin-binding autotransporter adhesin